jgi:hypothetical protein
MEEAATAAGLYQDWAYDLRQPMAMAEFKIDHQPLDPHPDHQSCIKCHKANLGEKDCFPVAVEDDVDGPVLEFACKDCITTRAVCDMCHKQLGDPYPKIGQYLCPSCADRYRSL